MMTKMYKQNFLCNPRLWRNLNSSFDFSVITTSALSDFDSAIKGYYVKMLFEEKIEVLMNSIKNPSALFNRLYFSYKAQEMLRRIIKDEKIDVIHCFGQFSGISVIPLANKQEIPVVFTTFNYLWSNRNDCTSFKNRFLFLLERKCMISASKVIVPSHDLAKNYERYLSVAPSRLSILSNPIDTELFSRLHVSQISTNNYQVIFVARIAPYKNQLSLIKAIPQILKRVKNTKFLFAGPISDYAYYNQIMDEIRKNGLSKVVQVLGTVSIERLIEIYREAQLFIILSNYEAGLPQTCLEALSSSLPVIVSDKSFFRQHFSNDFAVFVDAGSADEVTNAVVNLLIDEKKRVEMGRCARQYVEELCSYERYAKDLTAIYQDLISENSHH